MDIDVVDTELESGSVEHTFTDVEVLCPYKDGVTDSYTVTVEIANPGGKVPEIHSLALWLRSVASGEISHEDLAATIQGQLSDELPGEVSVSISGAHGETDTTVTVP